MAGGFTGVARTCGRCGRGAVHACVWVVTCAFRVLVFAVAGVIRVCQGLVGLLRGVTRRRLALVALFFAFLAVTGYTPPVLTQAAAASAALVGVAPSALHAIGFTVFVAAAFEVMVVVQTRSEATHGTTWDAVRRTRRRSKRRGAKGGASDGVVETKADDADDDDSEDDGNGSTSDSDAGGAFTRAKFSHSTEEYPPIDPLQVLTEKYKVPRIVAREMALMVLYIIRDFVGSWCVWVARSPSADAAY